MVTITLPRKIGVRSIEVYRRRAEVTIIEIGYFSDQLAVIDGRVEIPNHPGRRTYSPRDPDIYKPQRDGRRLFFNGYWRWGGDHIFEITKVVRANYVDRIELDFFTGNDEPWNTRVTIHLIGELKPIAGPSAAFENIDVSAQFAGLLDGDGGAPGDAAPSPASGLNRQYVLAVVLVTDVMKVTSEDVHQESANVVRLAASRNRADLDDVERRFTEVFDAVGRVYYKFVRFEEPILTIFSGAPVDA